jgi:hypothetical protein
LSIVVLDNAPTGGWLERSCGIGSAQSGSTLCSAHAREKSLKNFAWKWSQRGLPEKVSVRQRRGYGLRRSRLRIDGDGEGTLHLDHLPSLAGPKAIRQVMAIRKRRKQSGKLDAI